MEFLKNTILTAVNIKTEDNFTDVREYKDYVRVETLSIVKAGVRDEVSAEIWTEAIQKALDENKNVYIPDMGKTIFVDEPIIMRSDYALKVAPNQVIALTPNTNLCLVRNENLIHGAKNAVSRINPDRNISVEGGIWTALEKENGNGRLLSDKKNPAQGAFSVMLFSNVENIVIKNTKFEESLSYAVQISNCEGFYISDIKFKSYHKDGIHVNGPVKYGVIQNLEGDDMGDDMIALNAWDWHASAMTFGSISHLYINNIKSTNNELRILPGQKLFDDGSSVDCDIHDCVFENLSGIYTYKLYAQPYYLNKIKGINDVSGSVGRLYNLYFKNIEFPSIAQFGFANLIAVRGLFEICADCENINIENVNVAEDIEKLLKKDISLVKVGPLSATLKYVPDDVTKWIEIFDSDAVCTVESICLKDITMGGKRVTMEDAAKAVRAIRLTVNEDYPNTIPKGGTGYGKIEKVEIM